MTTTVYLDTDEDRTIPLHAVRIATDAWNGFPVPIVTASAFADFIHTWSAADLNGVWGPVHVDFDGYLIHRRSDAPNDDTDEDDVWGPLDETTATGERLYALDGWTWTR